MAGAPPPPSEPLDSAVAEPGAGDSAASTGPEPAQERACPRCGAPAQPLQEYCLECGLRLPGPEGVVAVLALGWRRRFRWYPGDWIWPTLLALAVAASSAAVLIVIRADEPPAAPRTIVATTEQPATTAVTTRAAPPEAQLPTTPGTGRATAPGRTTPRQTTRRRGLATWPAGRRGYTLVLRSIPTSAGRATARSEALRAREAGMPDVGLLESSRYASLHAGYYVVFSGVYDSLEDAEAALARARARGFGFAYPREIAS